MGPTKSFQKQEASLSDSHALLMERYPEIGFLFHCLPLDPFTLFTDETGKLNGERRELFLHSSKDDQPLDLEGTDILYIFGIGLGYSYGQHREWLKAKRGRALVYLEEDLGVIDALLRRGGEEVEALLRDPQVHLYCVPERKGWDSLIEELAQRFISDKVTCALLDAYRQLHGKRFKRFELKLLRATVALHALLSESLHAQKIFANLYPNMQRIPEAFYANRLDGRFENIPAIICGAGPSLNSAIPVLKELESRALIIAGGSSLAALSRHGIEPHFGMALDPNQEEYERLKPSTAFQVLFLYANRLLPAVFSMIGGPIGYLRSDTGGLTESWIEERLGIEGEAIGPDLGREAFSVTTMAVALAYAMGCNPIIFVGVDLAFTGMRRYAEGVLETGNKMAAASIRAEERLTERPLKRKDREGKTVYTSLKWVMESTCIGAYAKKRRKEHPERLFINATEGGIGFPHIPYQPLREAVSEHCTPTYDLRGKIHAETEQCRVFDIRPEALSVLFSELKESLERQLSLVDEILVEKTGRCVALEMDFVEEPAFDCFLQPLGPALDKLLGRYFPAEEHTVVKWKEIRSVIQQYLDILSKSGSGVCPAPDPLGAPVR